MIVLLQKGFHIIIKSLIGLFKFTPDVEQLFFLILVFGLSRNSHLFDNEVIDGFTKLFKRFYFCLYIFSKINLIFLRQSFKIFIDGKMYKSNPFFLIECEIFPIFCLHLIDNITLLRCAVFNSLIELTDSITIDQFL